jgi:hypothetical protein
MLLNRYFFVMTRQEFDRRSARMALVSFPFMIVFAVGISVGFHYFLTVRNQMLGWALLCGSWLLCGAILALVTRLLRYWIPLRCDQCGGGLYVRNIYQLRKEGRCPKCDAQLFD